MVTNPLRNLPSVNDLLDNPTLRGLVDRVSHSSVVSAARVTLDELRTEIQTATADRSVPNVTELADKIARRVMQSENADIRPVVNATGILLHTGLGRAPLSDDAITAIVESARDYANVEFDLASGERSQRARRVASLLTELTGAESAFVVNNNAGATLLALAALAVGREVVVSRGELVEIGGSYRLPDVMQASGAILREVGTTNRTHLTDYEQAIHPSTAALLKVHPSNFRIHGFSAEASLSELVKLGRHHEIPVIHDVGSGALVDLTPYGGADEPVVADSISTGADLVLFSGDKLLGGPQCGIILGSRKLVDDMMRHPLARALRVDKITLAALSATLQHYRDPESVARHVPLMQLLSTSAENLKHRASRIAPQLAATATIATADAVEDVTFFGGGSVPTAEIPTWCVALTPAEGSAERLAERLRTAPRPVVGRIKQDRLLLDLRSVFPRQDIQIVDAITALDDASADSQATAASETSDEHADPASTTV